MMMGEFGGSSKSRPSSSRSRSRCQDCGNQSKRECGYNRCRTCCKTKGFHCQTHIKSTWLPSISRLQQQTQSHILHQHNPKRPRRPIPSSGLEGVGNFPAETSFPATFGCVRVRSMEESVDHFAYQTSVNIGGHVFRGILYDQGPDCTNYSLGAPHQPNLLYNPNIASDHDHHHHHHDLTAAAGTLTNSTSSAHDHDQSHPNIASSYSYPFSFNNAFLPGTHFLPHSSKS